MVRPAFFRKLYDAGNAGLLLGPKIVAGKKVVIMSILLQPKRDCLPVDYLLYTDNISTISGANSDYQHRLYQ